MRSSHELPDVGNERRKDQKRGRFDRRHEKAQQTDRDGRQSHPDYALDAAGKDECQGYENNPVMGFLHPIELDRPATEGQFGSSVTCLRPRRRQEECR